MRHEDGACLLEWSASCDVIVVMMTVDDVADWRRGHPPNLREVHLRGLGVHRVGHDDTGRIDDEHRLVAAVLEDVDTVSNRF